MRERDDAETDGEWVLLGYLKGPAASMPSDGH
jgi:hypothetical protein